MSYEYVRFSLSSPSLEKLQAQCKDKESIHLASKRLLLEILENGESRESPIAPNELENIKTRLNTLESSLDWEERLTRIENAIADFCDRLETIEERIEEPSDELDGEGKLRAFDNAISEITERLTEMSDQLRYFEGFERAMIKVTAKLSERLEAMETTKEAAETQRFSSQDLQPTETSPAAGLTHSQLAKELGVNKSTPTRWVKKGVSPDGDWKWDGQNWEKVRGFADY